MNNNFLISLSFMSLFSMPLMAEEALGDKPDGTIERAQFTTNIENREPVDLVTELDNDVEQIRFFTDIRKMSGRTVTHRWEYQGRVMAEIDFEVGGPRWRVNSSKKLLPDQLGKWTVVVVDQSGWPMHAEIFEYRQVVVKVEEDPVPQEVIVEEMVEFPELPSETAIPEAEAELADDQIEIPETTTDALDIDLNVPKAPAGLVTQ